MAHIVEEAKSGRSKCRGCGEAIAKGEPRFGEVMPNPFADDADMTLWFHVACGAMRRPESFETVLGEPLVDKKALAPLVKIAIDNYRVERIAGIERAASARARCRHCREPIVKDAWRIPLVFFEEGMFNKSGFVHVTCAGDYFETKAIMPWLLHFGSNLSDDDVKEVESDLG